MIFYDDNEELDIATYVLLLNTNKKKPFIFSSKYAPDGYVFVKRIYGLYQETKETLEFDIYYNSTDDKYFFNTALNPKYTEITEVSYLTMFNNATSIGHLMEKIQDYVENYKYTYWNRGLEAWNQFNNNVMKEFKANVFDNINYKNWINVFSFIAYYDGKYSNGCFWYGNDGESFYTTYNSYFWKNDKYIGIHEGTIGTYYEQLEEDYNDYGNYTEAQYADLDYDDSYEAAEMLRKVWISYDPDPPEPEE